MDDSAKYLIHADFVANGVIERSDVVGAVFGQTEGLLGDDLDLRDLQQASKVGRIDVEVDSEGGQSSGTITIATTLDKVETAILAASLETIDRVGPCRSEVSVSEIEDVRAAKRREVVERAKELLVDAFDENIMDSREIREEVRGSVRVEDITDYHGLPAGPRVTDTDAIIVVEGRADVLTLLRYGIKNAVAVEGTNVPDAIAELTRERTVTAFLDGDRGGELILRELQQVGDVDYVAFAPTGRSVEDLARHEAMTALRQKQPVAAIEEGDYGPSAGDAAGPPKAPPGTTEIPSAQSTGDQSETTPEAIDLDEDVLDDSTSTASSDRPQTEEGRSDTTRAASPDSETAVDAADSDMQSAAECSTPAENDTPAETDAESDAPDSRSDTAADSAGSTGDSADATTDSADTTADSQSSPATLRDHARDVFETDVADVRLLDGDLGIQVETDSAGVFDAIADVDPVPYAVVFDGELTQQLLDVAAQRGVEHLLARSTGEYVKKPIGVRIRTAEDVLEPAEAA